MTGSDRSEDSRGEHGQPVRRARIETDPGDAGRAEQIAGSLAPDNTDEMTTRVEAGRVVTTISRTKTGSLQSTVDDYVVNLQVAAQLTDQDGEPSTDDSDTTPDQETET